MNPALITASGLLVLIGFAHSVLGERYILTRLFRRDVPRLFGGQEFTRRTLRFAWHVTTVAWWGFAALLWIAAGGELSTGEMLTVVSATFAVTGAIAGVASRGRHLSWIVFGTVAALAIWVA